MRLAETPPAYCVSCHSDCIGKEVVDFESYYDGPVVEEEHYKFQVDDLMICRDCLLQASKLIGLGDVAEYKKENEELGEAYEVRLKEIEALKNTTEGLMQANQELGSGRIFKIEDSVPSIKKPRKGKQEVPA